MKKRIDKLVRANTNNVTNPEKKSRKCSIVDKFNRVEDHNDKVMPLTMRNYVLLLIGAIIIVIGFILMVGGTTATPTEFSDDIFSWRRITLAPIVIILGFAFEIYAILKRF